MSFVTATGPVQHRLSPLATGVSYMWFTGFFPCIGVDKVKVTWKNRAVVGNFQSQPCLQYAPVRVDKPNAPTAVGTLLVGAGESCTGEVDISADTVGQLYMRVGIAYSLSSGSTQGGADVSMDVHYVSCGRVIGTVTRDYLAYNTGSVVNSISGFLSALET